ncbi:TerC/Alx family metal homeostasis membrane protein [Granulicella mallensis]|uniref:Integral membrane protein, TerC family n=1 Tax=Granulicella mallensis (strain ATCC BAA-1857 / DSM 23137 / MP5ACTX8) TaxID=682795 RepID=G8NTN2_GRAMM|nr:TerC/Alx family metal homeostasis membrane protein [Granulicella mallensis]AEU36356.1 integral membrane protein, TerC family [Granulicella mallensis MP5ACTX8]
MTPLSHWIWFHVAIVALLALEYLLHLAVPNTKRKAIYATILWVAAALSLAAVLVRFYTSAGAVQYLAGYAIEEALSIDNLFVFLLLFRLFRIPEVRQPRVLFWGVAGAIVMRGAFIAAGLGLLHRFHWISYAFGAILLFGAIRLLRPENPNDATQTPGWIRWLSKLSPISESQDHFFVRQNGRVMGTILLLALVAVELTDIVFALDSIPAVLSITRQPFLAYTSNIMAVMGLRSLYVLLAAMLAKLRFLHFGLAAVLAFAAIKMLLAAWIEIGPLVSLAVIAGLLSVTIGASLIFTHPPTQSVSS